MTQVLGFTSARYRALERLPEPSRIREKLGILGRVRTSEKIQVSILFLWPSLPRPSDFGLSSLGIHYIETKKNSEPTGMFSHASSEH